jgi:hypothetical protein
MATPHKRAPRRPVPVRLPPELVDRIDSLRGLVPREPWVRDVLGRAVEQLEQERGGER